MPAISGLGYKIYLTYLRVTTLFPKEQELNRIFACYHRDYQIKYTYYKYSWHFGGKGPLLFILINFFFSVLNF